jgi:hypothetical protein
MKNTQSIGIEMKKQQLDGQAPRFGAAGPYFGAALP